jgi:hypothetical protein
VSHKEFQVVASVENKKIVNYAFALGFFRFFSAISKRGFGTMWCPAKEPTSHLIIEMVTFFATNNPSKNWDRNKFKLFIKQADPFKTVQKRRYTKATFLATVLLLE